MFQVRFGGDSWIIVINYVLPLWEAAYGGGNKDEEVVACRAMKVCVFNYCLICVQYVFTWDGSERRWSGGMWRCKRRTQNNGTFYITILFLFLPIVPFFILLWGTNQRRRSCDMRNEGVYFLLLLFNFVSSNDILFRSCWGTSEDEEVTACGAMKVCVFYCYYSIRASSIGFLFI